MRPVTKQTFIPSLHSPSRWHGMPPGGDGGGGSLKIAFRRSGYVPRHAKNTFHVQSVVLNVVEATVAVVVVVVVVVAIAGCS